MDFQFGAGDVRIIDQPQAYSGHFSMRRLSLQHRLFGRVHSDTAGNISNGHTLIALQWLQIHGDALAQRGS